MDLRNNQQDEAKRGTADAGCCQTCHLMTRVAVAMGIILVIGLLVCLVFIGIQATWPRAPEVDQTQLIMTERCQKDLHDVNLMLLAVTQDSRCSVCPAGWRWWRSHCYFFSEGLQDDRRWNQSAEFCLQHNSSLTVIKDVAEMEFIQAVMRRFSHVPFLWVGLTDAKQEGQWLWGDGTDVQHYMTVTVEWDADHRDCADLRGDGGLFAASCEAYGPWSCKRDS